MSTDLYRSVFVEGGDALLLVRPGGELLDLNRRAAALSGFEPAALIGQPLSKLLAGVDEALLRAGRVSAARLIRKEKPPLDVELHAKVIPGGLVVTVREPSSFTGSDELLRQAVRVSSLGVFDHDHSTDVIFWSPEQRAFHGVGPEEVVTIPLLVSRVHPDDADRVAALVRRAHDPSGDGLFDLEYRVVQPEGEVRWLTTRSQTSFEGGRAVRTVGAVQDITSQKLAERERAALQAQLIQAQKMESVGRLAGGVAHDFNNLLTTIVTSVEFLHDAVTTSEAKEDVAQISAAADRAAVLTRQLLAFARRQPLQPVRLEAGALIQNLAGLLSRALGEQVRLVTRIEPNLPVIRADAGQLEQVIMNLCVNARDAMPHGGEVRVTVCEQKTPPPGARTLAITSRWVKICVADQGMGIPEALRERIFEPFFTTKSSGKGTGLGLAVSYGIVKQHGGEISWRSLSPGTVFEVVLPAVEGAADVPQVRLTPHIEGGTELVLVVDDDVMVRLAVARLLTAVGYEVLTAATGVEALAVMRAHPELSLVLIDAVMPGLDGIQTLEAIRAVWPATKAILMSGHLEEQGEGRVMPAGVPFLDKPFTPATLQYLVRSTLDGEPRGLQAASR